MKRTKLSTAVSWALFSSSVALSGALYAADDAKSGPSAKDRGAQTRDDAARSDRQVQVQGDRFWASDLIGRNVKMSGGRDAEIKDLIVNPQTGEIRHVVTEIDTDKAKDRLYAVPARMFQLGGDRKLTLNIEQNWLAQRKSWSGDKWPAMNDPGYWGDSPAPARGAASSPKSADVKGDAARPASPDTGMANLHRLSKLVGHDVHNAQGKQVGEIEDAVVNLKAQKVDFVLLSHDPGMTKAEKEYAVPLAAFRFPASTADGGDSKQRVVLTMADDKIRGMKPFEKADKKRINEPNFMQRFETKN
ncbi:MAG: PRC-barrel domain-containing protein [Betaproteobacteria bacterium]